MDYKSARYHKARLNKKIKFVYFDVGNVMVSLRGGFKKLAARIGVPYEKVTTHWNAHDDEMARGTLSMNDYWIKLKNDFEYTGPDIESMDYMASLHNPIVE